MKPIDIGNIIKNRQESFRRVSKKIKLHENYYKKSKENPNAHNLPRILQQMQGESDAAHAKRVKDYLLLLTDEQFTSFGYMIDPEDPDQT